MVEKKQAVERALIGAGIGLGVCILALLIGFKPFSLMNRILPAVLKKHECLVYFVVSPMLFTFAGIIISLLYWKAIVLLEFIRRQNDNHYQKTDYMPIMHESRDTTEITGIHNPILRIIITGIKIGIVTSFFVLGEDCNECMFAPGRWFFLIPIFFIALTIFLSIPAGITITLLSWLLFTLFASMYHTVCRKQRIPPNAQAENRGWKPWVLTNKINIYSLALLILGLSTWYFWKYLCLDKYDLVIDPDILGYVLTAWTAPVLPMILLRRRNGTS